MKKAVIIVAGGAGLRMGADLPKQFLSLAGIPILVRTVKAFHLYSPEMPIVLVLPEAHVSLWHKCSAGFLPDGRCIVTFGGTERFFSVRNGLNALAGFEGVIGVHDGVRPLLSAAMIARCFEAGAIHGAAVPVVSVSDSLRQLTTQGSIALDRASVKAVQTPQCFRSEVITKAYDLPFSPRFTDDASVVETCGYAITLVEGERANVKITAPEDLPIAEALLARMQAD